MRGLIAVAVTSMLAGTFGCGEVGDATKLLDGLVAGASEADQERSESEEMRDRAVEDRDMTREEIDREDTRRGEEGDERSDRTLDDCEALGLRLREMVANGELTAEEARERYNAACGGRDDERGRGRDDIRGRLIQVLMENGIARENVEGVMGVLRYIAREIHRQGDAFELHPGVRERLVHMNLTDEQIDLVVGLAHHLAGHEQMDWDREEE